MKARVDDQHTPYNEIITMFDQKAVSTGIIAANDSSDVLMHRKYIRDKKNRTEAK
jgi:hypothetical protein